MLLCYLIIMAFISSSGEFQRQFQKSALENF